MLAALLALPFAGAQSAAPSPGGDKATIIRVANIYVQPDESSSRVGEMTPGREMVVSEHSGKWLRVFADTDVETVSRQDAPVFGGEQNTPPISGWIIDKGVVEGSTPQGSVILFGEADETEAAASQPHSPPRAAEDARRLYRMVDELFPQSVLAPEAMWRAADIRWQLQKADVMSLPSAHEKEAYLREQLDESEMKKIERLFPGSKWADLAAYDMIDNKLCGDWQGSEKCPEQEAVIYGKYVEEHPDSPKAPEALYKAAWRLASAGDMWTADNNLKGAAQDRAAATKLAQQLEGKYTHSVYAARAASLVFKIQQSIPIYGTERE